MLSFEYQLTGAGWAQATIADGAHRAEMRVSYLSDALRDLTEVAIVLLEGAEDAACTWLDEPGEYRWRFQRQRDELQITIATIDDFWDKVEWLDEDAHRRWLAEQPAPRRPAQEAVLFATRCPLRRFSTQVLTQLWRIMTDVGVEGYKERWVRHDFPLTQYKRLEDLIRVHGNGRARPGP